MSSPFFLTSGPAGGLGIGTFDLMNRSSESSQPSLNRETRLIDLLTPLVAPLGYEIVHVEIQTQRQKILRLFIDHVEGTGKSGIGIEDCVTVSRSLDEPLDQVKEIEAIFQGAYELEVSSPGVDRPLRTARDYERFSGKDVRIHVFRPLTAEELGNQPYQAKNPKQKNFLGKLLGLRSDRVLLAISASGGADGVSKHGKKGTASKKAASSTNSAEEVTIPLPLIAKANLEPKFDEFADESE